MTGIRFVRPRNILRTNASQFLPNYLAFMTALTAICLLVSTVRADDLTAAPKKSPETGTSASESADAFPDTSLDPTVLSTQMSLSNEFKAQEFDAVKDTVTLNLSYAFGKTTRPDWTAQVDLPVVYYNPGKPKESKAVPVLATSSAGSDTSFIPRVFFVTPPDSRLNSIPPVDRRAVMGFFDSLR